jgi:penicillin-binding protein 2
MRWKILLLIIAILYFILLGKIYSISIKSHEYYEKLSQNNITKTVYLKPTRGIIYDNNNIPIAYNELRFSLLLKPHLKEKDLNKTLDDIANVLDIDKEKSYAIYKKISSNYHHEYITIEDYITYKSILPHFSTLSLHKNINIEPTYLRIYPFKESVSNILGYVSKANLEDMKDNKKVKITKVVGKSGIEKEYDDILQGDIGELVVKIDSRNRVLEELNETIAKSSNIKLNIDSNLQQYIYSIFQKSDKKGVAIVMDVNGKVLSMISYPSYDNNLFVKGISVEKWNKILHNIFNPFVNKAINGRYPPGSVIKPILGLIALNAKVVSPYQKIFCPEYLEYVDRKFRDWKRGGHGEVDIFKSIRSSVDVYYYKIGLQLGVDKIAKSMKRFGFGNRTGIDLPKESTGLVPNKEWKKRVRNQTWYIGETINVSIGQGYFLSTPIQVAVNTALLATGHMPTPMIANKINDKEKKPILKDVFTKEEKNQLKYVRKGMWQVCNAPGGTATNYLNTKVEIAGKTGTAQTFSIPQEVKERKREDELAYFRRSHAWLTTYGPYKNPQYVVTVLIEHGGHGGAAAGSIVSDIYNKLLELKYIK